MRTLKIESGGRISIEGELVDMSRVDDKNSFISSLLTLDVELSDDVQIEDIIHFFYDSKNIIRDILSEEYEVVRAVVTTAEFPVEYKCARVFKSFRVEKEGDDEFIYLAPEIELIPVGEGGDGFRRLSELNVVIDENVTLRTKDIDKEKVCIKSKAKISLMDVLICFFEELPMAIKSGITT